MRPHGMIMLLWKEWREHRLIFFVSLATVIITCIYFILILNLRKSVYDVSDTTLIVWSIYLLLPILFALIFGSAPYTNEFSRGTLSFLLCQPLTRARIYWTKYLFGLSLLILLSLFVSVAFLISESTYLFENTFVHLKYFPLIVFLVYSAAFATSLLFKDSLVAVIATPFVIAIGSLVVFLPLLPVVLCQPMQLFEGSAPFIISLTFSFLLVLFGLLCWYKAISRTKSPSKIIFFTILTLICIHLIIVVAFLLLFILGLTVYGSARQFWWQVTLILGFILSLIFILIGFLCWKKAISRSKYPGKVIGITLVSTISLFLVTHTITGLITERELKNAIISARKAGLPLAIEEIIPPPVPANENAAPIYEETFSIYEKLNKKHTEEWKYMPVETKTDIKELSSSQKSRLNELVFNDPDFVRMYELLEKAVNMPSCRFDLKYEDGPAMLLPHLAKMRANAKIIALRTILLTEENRYYEALESGMVGLLLGNALENEPFLVSQLVRIACDGLAMRGLAGTISDIPSDGIFVEEYYRLMKEIESKKGKSSLRKTLEGETALHGDVFRRIINTETHYNKIYWQYYFNYDKDDLRIRMYWRFYLRYFGRPLVRKDATFYLNQMTKAMGLDLTPYYQIKDNIIKMGKEMEKELVKWVHPLSSMILPALGSFHARQAEITAKFDGLEIALALKIYKSKNGEYPSSLDILIPEYLPELPKDPFTGQNYIYRREDEGFIVYSVGRDERDDGGLYDEKGFQRPHDDLAWRCLR